MTMPEKLAADKLMRQTNWEANAAGRAMGVGYCPTLECDHVAILSHFQLLVPQVQIMRKRRA